MLNLLEIYVEGFGSIVKPITYKLDRPGLNILRGNIGSGKTTLVDAVSWVLYGVKTKKKSSVQPWPKIITKDYRGTCVKIKFTINKIPHEIARCIDYKGKVFSKVGGNRLVVLRDGKELPIRSKNTLKEAIPEIVGYSYRLFKSTVLFGQRVENFMEAKPEDKKSILEEAFEIAFLTRALELAKSLRSKAQSDVQVVLSEQYATERIISTKTQAYKDKKALFKNFNTSKKQKLKELKTILKNLQPQVIAKEELEKKVTELTEGLSKLKDRRRKKSLKLSSGRIADMQKKSQNIVTEVSRLRIREAQLMESFDILKNGRVCTTCKQVVKKKTNDSESLKSLKLEIEDIRHNISLLIKKKNSLDSKVALEKNNLSNILINIEKSIDILEKDLGNTHKQLNAAYTKVAIYTHTKKSFRETKLEVNPISPGELEKEKLELRPLRKELLKVEERVSALKSSLKDYDWAIKDPLSNSGIKAYVFDTMLEKLNRKLEKYVDIIGFKLVVKIDFNSAYHNVVVHILRFGEEVPIEDLSGGQKQLSNLVLSLCFHSLANDTKPCNVLLMDECFEGLDEQGIQLVAEIISKISVNKSVHLITHRDFIPPNAKVSTAYLDLDKHTRIEN